MKTSKQRSGDLGENMATNYLKKHGFDIICRNFKCYWGEIDIIAKEKEEIVFVEVKTRKKIIGDTYGSPEDAVDRKKLSNIKTTAEFFLEKNNIADNTNWRIDIIAIKINWKRRVAQLKHIINVE
ncbi:YraN family protein [bacterium]|nr:MAG: YraN family protein [bacterium]